MLLVSFQPPPAPPIPPDPPGPPLEGLALSGYLLGHLSLESQVSPSPACTPQPPLHTHLSPPCMHTTLVPIGPELLTSRFTKALYDVRSTVP